MAGKQLLSVNYYQLMAGKQLLSVNYYQLMAGKQLLSVNYYPFGSLIFDQHVRESIKLIGFYHFFPQTE